MNITDQDWFTRAVEIAGWPEWLSAGKGHTQRFRLVYKQEHWQRQIWVGERWRDTKGRRTWHEADALLEKHFREWLEGNAWGARPELEVDAQDKPAGYSCWLPCLGTVPGIFGVDVAKHTVTGDTYLECQALAIIECEKKEHESGRAATACLAACAIGLGLPTWNTLRYSRLVWAIRLRIG